MIRQPIVSILAHVDHGKTTLLDYIRKTSVAKSEAGAITQHIGASEVPAEIIKKNSGELLKKFKIDLEIPGLLFIDTPGHAAFTLLRKRGGSLADIAILVIDITEGIKPQTDEAISILKHYKTPFIIAANKIDKLSGWVANKNSNFLESFDKQQSRIQEMLDTKIYELIGQLHERGFQTERFDRIQDFQKQVSIIPISALTGEGVPELLTLLTGLAQRYLENKLEIDPKGEGKGTILEVKEVTGLGTTIDVILYDGLIKKGDTLVIGNPSDVLETKVKALLKTNPLKELRVEKQFINVDEVSAAVGVKISALNLEEVVAGAPVWFLREGLDTSRAKQEVKKEIESIEIATEKEGVIIRADALGSLEALIKILQEMKIPIKKAKIGMVNKKDVIELEEVDDRYRVIFAFNTKILPEAEEIAKESETKVLQSDIIYRLTEDYEQYLKDLEESKKKEVLETITRPSKIRILPSCIFRQSKPAIVGVEVLGGILVQDIKLMNIKGDLIGKVIMVQDKGETIKEAKIGMQVAVSIEGAVIERNVKKDETLLTSLTKEEYKMLMENQDLLSDNEKNVLNEIKEIMVKKNPKWEFD